MAALLVLAALPATATANEALLSGADFIQSVEDRPGGQITATNVSTGVQRTVWSSPDGEVLDFSASGNRLAVAVGFQGVTADLGDHNLRSSTYTSSLVSVDLRTQSVATLATEVKKSFTATRRQEACGKTIGKPYVTDSDQILVGIESVSYNGIEGIKACAATRRSTLEVKRYDVNGAVKRIATLKSVDAKFATRRGSTKDVLPDLLVAANGKVFTSSKSAVSQLLPNGRLKRIVGLGPRDTLEKLVLGRRGDALLEVNHIAKKVTAGSLAPYTTVEIAYFSNLSSGQKRVISSKKRSVLVTHAARFCRSDVVAIWQQTPGGRGKARRMNSVRLVRTNGKSVSTIPLPAWAETRSVYCSAVTGVVFNEYENRDSPKFGLFPVPQ